MTEPSRRQVLRTGWKVGGALLAGAAGYTAYEALSPLTSLSVMELNSTSALSGSFSAE